MSEIELPEKLKDRPTYRGYVVPATVLWRGNIPDFKVTDTTMWRNVVMLRLCAICGKRLEAKKYLIGGPKCAEYLAFFDPPMHRECALYALRVCPFLGCRKDYVPLDNLPSDTKVLEHANVPQPDHFLIFGFTAYGLVQQGDAVFIRIIPDTLFLQLEVPKTFTEKEWDLFTLALP